MSDTVTPNLGLVLPGIGDVDGEDLWGQKLNSNFTVLDSFTATTLVDAPDDGAVYGRQSGTWQVIGATAPSWNDIVDKPVVFPPELPIPIAGVSGLESALAGKEPIIPPGNANYFLAGDKTWKPVSGSGGVTSVAWADITGKPTSFPPTLPISSANVVGLDDKQTAQDAAIATATTGREPVIAPGLTTQYWRGDKTWQTHDKASVGLGNVDNTSDLNKPISTAQSGVNAQKANIASPTFTGIPKAPTRATGDNDINIATTAFVQSAVATREPVIAPGSELYFWRGDKTWAPVTPGGSTFIDMDCGTFTLLDPLPVPADYPSAANTGPSGTLTVNNATEWYTGSNGQIIENTRFPNCRIYVRHNNVIIRNCEITCLTDFYCIDNTANGTLVEDCILTGTEGQVDNVITSVGSITINRCEISHGVGGVYWNGTCTVTNSYIHSLVGGSTAHYDGIQTEASGPGPSLIQHNTIIARDTSHVFLQSTFGDVINVKVLDNQFLNDPTFGGPGWNVYLDGWGKDRITDQPVTRLVSNCEVAYNFGDRGTGGGVSIAGNTSNLSVHDNMMGVAPPPSTVGVTFFGGASPGGGAATSDNNQMTLGARVDPLVAGNINAVLFYRADAKAAAAGKVAVYNAATGAKLAEASFTGHTGAGWKRVALASPLAVNATTAYVVAVWLQVGSDAHSWYWAEAAKFSSAGITVAGKMTMPRSDGLTSRGAAQRNNLFVYASGDIAFPDQTFGGAGYYIDVDFS